MADTTAPAVELADRIAREVQRSILRNRNGLLYMAGAFSPKVGLSRKHTVWSDGKIELWRYESDMVRFRTPVLLIPSVVSRSYILDLRPAKSFIGALLTAGFDVFMVDWGVPDASDAGNTLATYVDRYLPASLVEVLEKSESKEAHIVGYCLGGVLALLFAAAHPSPKIHTLVTMATPVDFSAMTLMAAALRDGRLEPDMLIDTTGNVPPDVIYESFQMLRPTDRMVQYVSLLDKLWNDEYLHDYAAMGQWARDQVPFPGALLREVTAGFIRRNELVGGRSRLGGREVDLGSVTCPVLNVVAERDHIVPPAAARPILSVVGSTDTTELALSGGHVSFLIGREAANKAWPAIAHWLEVRSRVA